MGDEFLAGVDLQPFRILGIDPTMDPEEAAAPWHAVSVVEPVN